MNKYVWIDLEMTGLDPNTDTILEVACLITTPDMKPFDAGINLVIHQEKRVLDSMNEWCMEHHTESGLVEACKASNITLSEAEARVYKYILGHSCKAGRNYLAGNSVHTDLLFLKKYMPSVASTLHYRILDVSSIKIIATDWFGTNVEINKKKTHRALDDIKESIQELQNYRSTIFK
ncbi:hypothetical protein RUM43_013884 [Polyplax serrata]|uniref:Probable oligoribonuclease n=1 Tax=Polyplax serrata TaxID=468196 RepID=A0AAN8PH36_POLSC